MRSQRLTLVDCEASGPSPFSGRCTEFAAVDLLSRATFYAHLWPSTPHPDTPALPVIAPDAEPEPWFQVDGGRLGGLAEGRQTRESIAQVFEAFGGWLRDGADFPVLVSDNPGFDAQWIAYGFDSCGLENPFGHSSRRIGDLAAGLTGDYRNTSEWKRRRKTPHTHSPVDDALGNAEALEYLLRAHQQVGWRSGPTRAKGSARGFDKDLDGAAFSVWLHGDWRWLTQQMTTPEKEAFADAADRHQRLLYTDDDDANPSGVSRWWRDDAPPSSRSAYQRRVNPA